MRHGKLIGVLVLLLAGLLAPCWGQLPVFTGNVETDFTGPAVVTVYDGKDVEMGAGFEGAISGWDIKDVRLVYDAYTDTLCIGVNTYGIAGDADGDGDPGTAGAVLAAQGGTDPAGVGGSEGVAVVLDANGDFEPDVAITVGGYGEAIAEGIPWATLYLGNAPPPPAPTPYAVLFAIPSEDQPDLEFILVGLAELMGDSYELNLLVALGSIGLDGGIGEESAEASITLPRSGYIGGTVWADANSNGLRESSEVGTQGVGLVLIADRDGDGSVSAGDSELASATTDGSGIYGFGALLPGDYLVLVRDEDGVLLNVVLTAGVDPRPVELSPGLVYLAADFGYGLQLQPQSGSIEGTVWRDVDSDGERDADDLGIEGVDLVLTDADGNVWTVTTLDDGTYRLYGLSPGNYLLQVQDTDSILGNLVLTAGQDPRLVVLSTGSSLTGVDFGYGPPQPIVPGDTATIGFWHNKNGQSLIKSLNGPGDSTALGDWLAELVPGLWGDLKHADNAAVAKCLIDLYKAKGMKVEAQMMAVALAAYATSRTLAGGDWAERYGFTVTEDGILTTRYYDVGKYASAFGVEAGESTELTIMQLFVQLNEEKAASGGFVYEGNKRLRSAVNEVFSGINEQGDIP